LKQEGLELGNKKVKKKKPLQSLQITGYFGSKDPYKKCDQPQHNSITNLVLLIAKDCISLYLIDS
jgi:hypothetical protein